MLDVRTAGDPDDATILWTDLSPPILAETMAEMGTPVSAPTIADWLEDQNLKRRNRCTAGTRSHWSPPLPFVLRCSP